MLLALPVPPHGPRKDMKIHELPAQSVVLSIFIQGIKVLVLGRQLLAVCSPDLSDYSVAYLAAKGS